MDWKGVKGVIMKDVAMKRYTSMKVGGPARYPHIPGRCGRPGGESLEGSPDEGTRTRILGNGTNVIVHDRGIDEALIRITRMRHLRYRKAGRRRDGGGLGGRSPEPAHPGECAARALGP